MFYIILIIWLILDASTKALAHFYIVEKIPLIWDFLYIDLHYNSGIAFGIPIPSLLLKIGTIALIIWIFCYYRDELKKEKIEKNKNLLSISFWLIIAWAIWNAFERVFFERVIDFVWVKYFSIFNAADSFITIWAITLVYYYYKKK